MTLKVHTYLIGFHTKEMEQNKQAGMWSCYEEQFREIFDILGTNFDYISSIAQSEAQLTIIITISTTYVRIPIT